MTLTIAENVPPLPHSPVRRGLLVAATELTDAGDRWVGGFKYDPYTCEAVDPLPLNCTPLDDDKPLPDQSPHVEYSPFLVFGGDRCSSLDRGRDRGALARANLAATESWQAEREYWAGVASATADDPNPFITDGTADEVTTAAGSILTAVSLIEQALAECLHGQRGSLLVPPAVVPVLDAAGLTRVDGALLLTANDNVVISGGGFDGRDPDGNAVDLADVAWIYATGWTYFRRGPVTPVGDEASNVDRSTNTITTVVERAMAVMAAGCCKLAAEVDMTRATGVDGGGA